MEFTVCALLTALVVYSVEGVHRDKETKDLLAAFKELINKNAQLVIADVTESKQSLKKNVQEFIQIEESKINSSIATVIKDISLFKYGFSFECFEKAVKELVTAQLAAIGQLEDCLNLSEAVQDMDAVAKKADAIIRDVENDVVLLEEGIKECNQDFLPDPCYMKYMIRAMEQVGEQYSDVKQFVQSAQQLEEDVQADITGCGKETNVEEQIIHKALTEFYECFHEAQQKL